MSLTTAVRTGLTLARGTRFVSASGLKPAAHARQATALLPSGLGTRQLAVGRRWFTSTQQDMAEELETIVRRDDSVEGLLAGLVQGDRYALARAITLVESTNPKHRVQAQQLLSKILERESSLASQQSTTLASAAPSLDDKPATGTDLSLTSTSSNTVTSKAGSDSTEQLEPALRLGRSFRIGLSGPPGVGKSTFIEAFGMYLAVDPSSSRTGGSILGDKTRMTELSRNTMAYVRPSPSRGTLGGVARNTTEAITLCEAAGYDICLVETVGVGQSETMVADIVDMFVLLVPPAGGDELQGMKKGIMELSDLVIVNKSDGALVDSARYAQIEYTSALKFVKAITSYWKAKVIRVSSMGGPEGGIEQAWNTMKEYFHIMESSGELQRKRGNQRKILMWRQVSSELMDLLHEDDQVRAMSIELEDKVLKNEVMSGAAAHQIVERIYGHEAPTLATLTTDTQELEELGQNSVQDRQVSIHFVEFTTADLKATAGAKRATVYLLFEQRTDVSRFLEMAAQLEVFPKPRRALLLVNPCGGIGIAKTISDTVVKPMLQHSGLIVKEQYTEYRRHAVDIAYKVDLDDVDTLLVVSGDGVLHEVINGLLSRPDWDRARQLPVGLVPAGSGNAIATSLGTRNTFVATLAAIRGRTAKLDIFSASQRDRPRIYSMLLFSWGMMADADIESDKYRWLGGLRFEIAGFIRMIRLRRYPGKVYVLPPKHTQVSTITPPDSPDRIRSQPKIQYASLLERDADEPPKPWRKLQDMPFFSMLLSINFPCVSEDVFFSGSIRFNDGIMRLWYSCETRFWRILLPFVLDQKNGKLVERGLMQHTECGGILIVPGVEGTPDDVATHEIVDADSVSSSSARKLGIYQRPGVFDIDGEVMPTARTLIEIHPGFMNLIVPEWFHHAQQSEAEAEAEQEGVARHKAEMLQEVARARAVVVSQIRQATLLLLAMATVISTYAVFFSEGFQLWSGIARRV
ncbi:hypothetical protein EC968_007533 [Mortierella alpina]|nr:hypothetical protein EC968_007533 [Mortierella alpina]